VRATDYAGNVGEDSVTFTVDSTKPIILRQEPRHKKYTDGTFTVVYSEDNLKNISLYYKGVLEGSYNEVTKDTCDSGKKKECAFNVDLNAYEGEFIDYYFVVRDYVNEKQGRTYTVKVDTEPPQITLNSPEEVIYSSTWVPMDIELDEEVTLEYSDNGGEFV